MNVTCVSVPCLICAALLCGCMSMMIEEDGVPVGNREGLIMVNPAAHLLSEVSSIVEITYEKTLNSKDSSLVTVGFGTDDRDDSQSSSLYMLAGGRLYPNGDAPAGFFINGDIGVGQFNYDITGNTDVTFIYGVSIGYKYVIEGFVGELGAGYMKMDFQENDEEFIPLLRIGAGMKF